MKNVNKTMCFINLFIQINTINTIKKYKLTKTLYLIKNKYLCIMDQ